MTAGYQGLYSLLGCACEETKFYFALFFRLRWDIHFGLSFFTQFNVCDVRCSNSGLSAFYLGLDLISRVSDRSPTGAASIRRQLLTYTQKGNH
jgi:hypothetical protein